MSNTHSWQFDFRKLTAIKAQEEGFASDGDEPYFVFFGIRSKFQVPNSTQVFLNDYFDDEWAEGIGSGESKDIPNKMGVLTFPDVDVLSPSDVLKGQFPELIGFIGIAFESDATPFGEISDLMNKVRDAAFQEVKRLIEDGKINIQDPKTDIQQAIQNVQNAVRLTTWDKIRIGLSSFADPDELIGITNEFFIAGDSSLKSYLFQQDSPFGVLESKDLQLNFQGYGAHYQVDGVLETFNIAPTAVVAGDTFGVPGMSRSFSLFATDPSNADTAAGFTFNVDFGDGTSQVVLPNDLPTITHVYKTEGTKTITVTATDREGGVSEVVAHTVEIKTVGIFPDPTDDNQTALFIGATSENETIKVEQQGEGNIYNVVINGQSKGTFAPTGRVAIYGQEGNNSIDALNSRLPVEMYGGNGNDSLKGGLNNDRLYGDEGNDSLFGDAGNDLLSDNGGNDTLIGGEGSDSMFGGTGDDSYDVDNTGDVITERVDQGNDTVKSSISYTLGDNVENLTLTGNNAINGNGNSLNNIITGNNANNALNGGAGNDTLNGQDGDDFLDGSSGDDSLLGGKGNDTYYVDSINDTTTENPNEGTDTVNSSVSYTLTENLEKLNLTGNNPINGTGNSIDNIITGNSANNTLKGEAGNDTLNAGQGDDTLDGGLGSDSMFGGQGNDSYFIDNINDTVTESMNEGIDTVLSGITYTLGNNLENLTLTGNNAINGTGNSLDNIITGNNAGNYFYAGDGKDTVYGQAGNDYLYGQSGNDTLFGEEGNDSLDGGFGTNSMYGGLGNDSYFVDSIDNTITESANEGTDIVYSSITYTLGDNLENLTLTGNSATNGIGNIINNIINGNEAANSLDGKAGNDTLFGNGGNDSLFGDIGDDKLIGGIGADTLNGGDGIDTASYFNATSGIFANLSTGQGTDGDASGDIYQFIENLEGSEFSDRLFGDGQNNSLWGLSGDDILNGFAGADLMQGGLGNDTYFIDNTGDSITELANQGIDLVNSAINYTLTSNVENLNLLEGTAALNGTGNELNNIINGNSAHNTIDGAAGNDILYGFAGNDTINGGDGDDWIYSGIGNESVPGSMGQITGIKGSDILTGGNGNDYFAYNNITEGGDRITDFTVGSDKVVLTEVINSSGLRGYNLLGDVFSFRQANNMVVMLIDTDGAGSLFRPTPFLLFNNVSAAALNNSNNFIF